MSKNPIAVEDLAKLHTPAGTDTHTPIPHATLVDYTRKALERAGLEITEEEHGLSRGDLRYFGGFAITGKGIDSCCIFKKCICYFNVHTFGWLVKLT